MIRRILSFFILLFCISIASVEAQESTLTISGIVKGQDTKEPIPFATVMVMDAETNQIIVGVNTNFDGSFELPSSKSQVFLEISFIGYENKIINDFELDGEKLNLGEIFLEVAPLEIDKVEITAEKSSVEFKLDKRVFNVGQDISSSGMGALEVLNQVPSVNVDIEGQITLRGNSGVQILINGKPSVLADEGSNALGSITADMIESIEVITNPSAKYEAEGSSGILNIILKKEEKRGFNGSISANTGIPDNHSFGVSMNKRTEKFNIFTQLGAGYRSLPRYNENNNQNLSTGSEILSEGTEYRNERFYNMTLGSDYYINDWNELTLSGSFAFEDEKQPSETEFTELSDPNEIVSRWRRNEATTASNPKYQYDLQYQKQFKNNKEHVLLFSTQGSFFGKKQESEFENTTLQGELENSSQRTETEFYQADYTVKADYTNPFREAWTLESGFQYQLNDVGNDYAVSDLIDGVWTPDSSLTNNFEYDQKVFGAYSTLSYEGKKWGLKLGLRAENTELNTLLVTTEKENDQNYTNLFPSAHTSFKVSEFVSFQAGYSKRIFRPRLWDLNPFFNIRNTFAIRTGNPDLQPEFTDSYELTGIFIFHGITLNSSLYHLYTTSNIERVSTFVDNVNITQPVNVGSNAKTGLEFNYKYIITEKITLTGDFNYGFFTRKGQFENQNFDFQGQQWSSEGTIKFKLPASIDLEISAEYESGFKTFQGEVAQTAYMNIGLRKKIKEGKFIINASVRDIFASRIRQNTVLQPDFYLFSSSKRGRFVTFGVNYSIGKGEAMTYSGRRH